MARRVQRVWEQVPEWEKRRVPCVVVLAPARASPRNTLDRMRSDTVCGARTAYSLIEVQRP